VREVTHTLRLLSSLVQAQPPPTTLFLPFVLSPDVISMKQSNKGDVLGLIALCKEKKVEIVWMRNEPRYSYVVSPSFWRYAKELKAKQAVEH
jgi:hypothetical protein